MMLTSLAKPIACPKHNTGGGPCYCARAQDRLRIAEQADGCVKWLKAQGFDVIRVGKGACGPRIIIRQSPLCKKLDGTVAGYSRLAACNRSNELRYSFTYRFDCEVWWAESEAN